MGKIMHEAFQKKFHLSCNIMRQYEILWQVFCPKKGALCIFRIWESKNQKCGSKLNLSVLMINEQHFLRSATLSEYFKHCKAMFFLNKFFHHFHRVGYWLKNAPKTYKWTFKFPKKCPGPCRGSRSWRRSLPRGRRSRGSAEGPPRSAPGTRTCSARTAPCREGWRRCWRMLWNVMKSRSRRIALSTDVLSRRVWRHKPSQKNCNKDWITVVMFHLSFLKSHTHKKRYGKIFTESLTSNRSRSK